MIEHIPAKLFTPVVSFNEPNPYEQGYFISQRQRLISYSNSIRIVGAYLTRQTKKFTTGTTNNDDTN